MTCCTNNFWLIEFSVTIYLFAAGNQFLPHKYIALHFIILPHVLLSTLIHQARSLFQKLRSSLKITLHLTDVLLALNTNATDTITKRNSSGVIFIYFLYFCILYTLSRHFSSHPDVQSTRQHSYSQPVASEHHLMGCGSSGSKIAIFIICNLQR